MKLIVIFPQTGWLNSEIGFSGIERLRKDLLKMKQNAEIQFQYRREYQAVVFELLIANEEIIQPALSVVQNILPENYKIPALLENSYLIISRIEINTCDSNNDIFQSLLQDAHLQLSNEKIQKFSRLNLSEINKLCDEFSEYEGFVAPLKEFDLVELNSLIALREDFNHKLIGTLIDIKTNFFALDYELVYSQSNYDCVEVQMNDSIRKSYIEFRRYMHCSNAIVRIRALWEKLIGLAILLEEPKDFDKVQGSKSVKSEFIKRFENAKHSITQLIWRYLHSMVFFDEQFRTPELHKTGRVIHWATQENYGVEINRLLGYRNNLNKVLRDIVYLLNKDKQKSYSL